MFGCYHSRNMTVDFRSTGYVLSTFIHSAKTRIPKALKWDSCLLVCSNFFLVPFVIVCVSEIRKSKFKIYERDNSQGKPIKLSKEPKLAAQNCLIIRRARNRKEDCNKAIKIFIIASHFIFSIIFALVKKFSRGNAR